MSLYMSQIHNCVSLTLMPCKLFADRVSCSLSTADTAQATVRPSERVIEGSKSIVTQ